MERVIWGEEGWTERNGSILTTLEPEAIMPPGAHGNIRHEARVSAQQSRPSVAIERVDQYRGKSKLF